MNKSALQKLNTLTIALHANVLSEISLSMTLQGSNNNR